MVVIELYPVTRARGDIVKNPSLQVAVLIPCYNEEVAIADTVAGFRKALPQATIYVYDNNSKDRTKERAAQAGAVVRSENLQGKGNVVRRMFSDIDADVYVMADGDATYDPASARQMIDLLCNENLDMVVGRRIHEQAEAYRAGHVLGNKLLTGFLATLFGQRFTDILSGYRVFSRRYVKSFPALATGFETETELTVHALTLCLPIAETETRYFARAEGSVSKLSTYRDGFRILGVILTLFKNERPALFLRHFGGHAGSDFRGAGSAHRPDIHGNRSRTPFPDGHPVRIDHAAGFPQHRLRPDPRDRHARTP